MNTIKLNTSHYDAKRMEFFLNDVEDELMEIPFDWKSWKQSDCIEEGFRFVTKVAKDKMIITVLFCSYNDAKVIAEANGLTYLPTAKWSQNGGLTYFVECANAEKVSAVLSLFAGEE